MRHKIQVADACFEAHTKKNEEILEEMQLAHDKLKSRTDVMLVVPNLIGTEGAHYSSFEDFVSTLHEWMGEKMKEPKNCS
jgi:hypothetical protein